MKEASIITLIVFSMFSICLAQKKDEPKKNRRDKTIEVEIFQEVDRAPEFPGGEEKLTEFIEAHQQFPNVGSEVEFDSTVHLIYLLRADGSIDHSSIKIEKSAGDKFDGEAVRLLQTMPNWTPAYSSVVAKEVDVWVRIPIRFKKTVTYN